MGFTNDLVSGVAQLLEDAGVGQWAADGGAYAPGPPPIVTASMPASPNKVIVITPYPVDDDAALTDSLNGLQIRTRGDKDPNTVNDLDDAVFDALQGRSALVLSSGVHVVQIYRNSGASLGTDGNGRHERTANYYVQAARPSAHRTD